MRSIDQIRKLLFRLDGAADSETVEFRSRSGRRWEAEICLFAGTDPQAGRPKVIFRCLDESAEPQRYNEIPPGLPKVPREAADRLTEEELRDLLATSVKV